MGAAGEALEFRDLVPSGRAAALGGAVVALPGLDGAALNPAALAFQDQGALQGSHMGLAQDVSVDQLLLAWLPGFGALAGDVRLLSSPDLAGLDASGQPTGATVAGRQGAYGLAWGGQWRGIGLGMEASAVTQDLGTQHADGVALDGGLEWALPVGLRLGASLRNGGWLGALESSSDPLPAETALGAAWSLATDDASVGVSVQALRQGGGGWQGTAALELGLGGLAFARGSYTPVQPASQTGPWAAGVGARLSFLDLDGAWIPYGDMGNSFRVSATLYPGKWNGLGSGGGLRPRLGANQGSTTLTWTPQAGAAGYWVYRQDAANGAWARLTRKPVQGSALRLKGLDAGRTGALGVSAVAADGREGSMEQVLVPR